MSYETTYRHYCQRMRDALAPLRARGGGVLWEDNGDDWGWHVTFGEGEEGSIDVSLILEDAEEHEGEDGKGLGNFSLHAAEFGGRVLAAYIPHNYTPDMWVKLSSEGWPELDRRLALIKDAVERLEL